MDDLAPIVMAFSADQVVRLTGLSHGQLAYWDRTGFFSPEHPSGHPGAPYDRIYSFRDVVGLRTLRVLRGKHGVSLQNLRKTALELTSYSERPWSEIQLMVWNRRVVFLDPVTGKPREAITGQYVLLPIIEIIEDLRKEVDSLKGRDPKQIGKIEQHRHVSHNARVIAGTRVPVATIRRFLEDGYGVDEILQEYPQLTRDDIAAVEDDKAA